MSVVKRPGSLYFSAISVLRFHTEPANLGSIIGPGRLLVAWPLMISITAAVDSLGPCFIMSAHFLSVGSASSSALPSLSSVMMPMPSEWSVTATQSSGALSLTGCPLVETTSSPRAKRVASSGPSVVPKPPASTDHEVCTCSSPQYGRSGYLRPANGE
jgi:hypothetical protein